MIIMQYRLALIADTNNVLGFTKRLHYQTLNNISSTVYSYPGDYLTLDILVNVVIRHLTFDRIGITAPQHLASHHILKEYIGRWV